MEKTTKATSTAGTVAEAEKNEDAVAMKVTYTVEEFAKAAENVFDRPIHQDIITGAFKMAGKHEATKEEAAKLVSEFLGKEVKVK